MSDDDNYNTINLVISRSDGNEIRYKIAKKDVGYSIVLPKRFETQADKIEKDNILLECFDNKIYSEKQLVLLRKIPKDFIYIGNPQQLLKGRYVYIMDNISYDLRYGIIIEFNKRYLVVRSSTNSYQKHFHDQNYYFMKKFYRKSDLRLQLEKIVEDSEKPKSMNRNDELEWETDSDASTEYETVTESDED